VINAFPAQQRDPPVATRGTGGPLRLEVTHALVRRAHVRQHQGQDIGVERVAMRDANRWDNDALLNEFGRTRGMLPGLIPPTSA
jgi:hypothetical protein